MSVLSVQAGQKRGLALPKLELQATVGQEVWLGLNLGQFLGGAGRTGRARTVELCLQPLLVVVLMMDEHTIPQQLGSAGITVVLRLYYGCLSISKD